MHLPVNIYQSILSCILCLVVHSCAGCDVPLKLDNSTKPVDITVYSSGKTFITNRITDNNNNSNGDTNIDICLCPKLPCIRKCCLPNEVFVATEIKDYDSNVTYVRKLCVPARTVNESVYEIFNFENKHSKFGNISEKYGVISGLIKCETYRLNYSSKEYDILPNGSIAYDVPRVARDVNKYCLEYINDDVYAYMCAEKEPITIKIHYDLMVEQMISIFFSIVTIVVYWLINELKNVNGKILINYLLSLVCMYSLLFCLKSGFISYKDGRLCYIAGFLLQFSSLSNLFWLNTGCFDLWKAFKGSHSRRTGNVRASEARQVRTYSLYAWGIPLLITSATMLAQFWDLIFAFSKPEVGMQSCWLGDTTSLVIYFYGPISILLMLNMAMFVQTTLIIRRHELEAKILHEGDQSCCNIERQRFWIYLKLFLVMGLHWTLTIFCWIVRVPTYVWHVSETWNSLQGFWSFYIFVCNRKVVSLLNRKLCPSRKFFKNKKSTTGGPQTQSSTNRQTFSSSIKQRDDIKIQY